MKVLIITDNITQYNRFKTYLDEFWQQKEIVFEFKHSGVESPLFEHKDFVDKSDASIYVKTQYREIIKYYDLVISLHCKQFFPKTLVNSIRCINVHPGYNPINRGWYPQVFAIIHDLQIGATIHEMDEKLDNGKIIVREIVPKYTWDTSLSLYNRILDKEMELLTSNFNAIVDNSYQLTTPEDNGNIFNRKDFENLLEFDLDEINTFENFYNKLRALSHGAFNNAFIKDKNNGEKIYLSLNIKNDKIE